MLIIEYSNKNQLPDDVISSKINQVSENQGQDTLHDTTKNQASEIIIDKDVEGSNNPKIKQKKKYYQMMLLHTKVIKKEIE